MYVQVPTRIGEDGARDKAALINSLASWTARTNRDFLNKVREVVKDEKTAAGQVDRWFHFVNSKTYSREFGDVFSHPNSTIQHGGDCDDSAIALLAGILALGIPAVPDVVLRKVGGEYNGCHVRVRVGLPPHDPPRNMNDWKILDSSRIGERDWVGGGELYTPKTVSHGENILTGERQPRLSAQGFVFLGLLAVVGFAFRIRGNNDVRK